MDRRQGDAAMHAPETRAARPLPPAVRAVLWLDGVLVVAGLLALVGAAPALGYGASASTWLALVGAVLTTVLAALAAFYLAEPDTNPAWWWLPMPAVFLWVAASGLGCMALPRGADVWGDSPREAGQCLMFLLNVAVPLLGLMFFMLWRSAPAVRGRALAMGALAAAGAAASLLAIVHPHDTALLDLGAHAAALGIVLGIAAIAARVQPRT